MIRNSKEKEISPKQEGIINDGKINKGPATSRHWLGLKDPRIVRVSRTCGGKDRHSKVCTIRGLRDRRIRLSVPTAIQLYDLQDRLGLNQPSKVVDWLLNAAQHAIDELPPLQVPPENFVQYPQSMAASHEMTPPQIPFSSGISENANYLEDSGAHSLTLLSGKEKFKGNQNFVEDDQTRSSKSTFWNSDASLRGKNKEITKEIIRRNEQVNQESIQVQTHHIPLPRPIHSSFSGLLNNVMPHTSYYHWEPPYAYLSHSGTHGYSWHAEESHNNAILLPPALSLSSGSQLLLPSIFPSYVSTQVDNDPKQIHQSQMLSSTSQNLQPSSLSSSLYSTSPAIRPFQMYQNPRNQHSQNNPENRSDDAEATLGSNPSSFM